MVLPRLPFCFGDSSMFRLCAVISGAVAILFSSLAMTQDPPPGGQQVYIKCVANPNCNGYLWNGSTGRPTGCNSSCIGTCTWCENAGTQNPADVCRESQTSATCNAQYGQGPICADMFAPPCEVQNGLCKCKLPWGYPVWEDEDLQIQARCRWNCT
jgi:hypothetical protein